MDYLAVEETGKTGHYMTFDLSCDNKQHTNENGEIFVSTHTSLLSQQELLIQARKEHLFPGLNKALLSIGTL